jgi:hypothetical protein
MFFIWWGNYKSSVNVQGMWNFASNLKHLMHVVLSWIKQVGLDLVICFAYFIGVF